MHKAKVLFIYPSPFRTTGLPIGIASLSAVLKKEGYQVKIFETTFYLQGSQCISDIDVRAKRGMSKVIDNEDNLLMANTTSIEDDFMKLIVEYQPQIVGISFLESVYASSLKLLKILKKQYKDIITVAGGVFTMLSPETVISEDSIDIICVGEGEIPFLELCNCISTKEPYLNIDGLWVKNNGQIIKNSPAKLQLLDKLPHPDFTAFDYRMFYKPMQGKLYKMVTIETTRGCPFNCTYCAAPRLKDSFRENKSGHYYRKRSIEKVIEQIHYQIKRHSPEFIYFSSETFLAMPDEDFKYFVDEYKKINLPFWFQTRFETITREKIKQLKEIGMYWLTLGIEHGNEEFRKKVLKRHTSNTKIIEGVKILKEFDLGASLNNLMGLPFETRHLVFDTIRLNRQLYQMNNKLEFNIFMFTPFKGCNLYDICVKNALIEDRPYIDVTNITDDTLLNFSPELKKEFKGLIKTFNLYIKLPEEYEPQIRIAERDDEEGKAMYDKLLNVITSQSVN